MTVQPVKKGFKKRKQLSSDRRQKANDASADTEKKSTEHDESKTDTTVAKKTDSISDPEKEVNLELESRAVGESRQIKRQKLSDEVSLSSHAPGKEMRALATGVPKNIRTTTITDFQPDVCKDFLQTGYCGYGDTCKFIHVRNESVQKKPVTRDWEVAAQKNKQESKDIKKTSEVPFKCVLCKKDYVDPVETTCGHVFCKLCFMSRYKKRKTRCFICHEETNGIIAPYKGKV